MGQHPDQAHARHRELLDHLESGRGAQAGGPGGGRAARVARRGGRRGVIGNRNGGGREEGLLPSCVLPRRSFGGAAQRLCTATRSQTKMSDSFGAITGGAPWAP
ncbi:hypothetical protein GCM10023160_23120 [Brachybacterium paraconglomeratum]